VVLDPFQIDRDVAFHEVKAGIAEQRTHALGLQVHAVYMPIRVSQDVLAQVMADEAIDPENQNVFQNKPLLTKIPLVSYLARVPNPKPE
jgi:hypothetical protein